MDFAANTIDASLEVKDTILETSTRIVVNSATKQNETIGRKLASFSGIDNDEQPGPDQTEDSSKSSQKLEEVLTIGTDIAFALNPAITAAVGGSVVLANRANTEIKKAVAPKQSQTPQAKLPKNKP